MKRAASYIRSSTTMPHAASSAAAQKRDIALFAAKNRIAIVDTFSDFGLGSFQPDLERLLSLTGSGEFDAILIADHTRLSRCKAELAEIQVRCAKRGVQIISCS